MSETNIIVGSEIIDVVVTTDTIDVTSAGEAGPPGPGVPSGGTTDQVLGKLSDTDYDTGWIDAAAGGGGATNLAYTASPTQGVVTSDTGTDATLTVADGTNAGLLTPAEFTKLAGIETGATGDQTAAEILAALLTVDGSGSGLDADLLDGISSAGFATAAALAQELTDRAAADTTEASARAAADALLIPLAQRAAANGVATLDAGGLIPSAQLPPIAISNVYPVASQAAMLALTAERGDVALRTDLDPDGWFVLTTDSPGTLADWKQITAVGAVSSVDGRTGTVSLTDLYDAIGAAAAAQAAAIAAAATDATTKADAKVSDVAYDATSWDGDTTHAPSKNAVRDKIEGLSGAYLSLAAASETIDDRVAALLVAGANVTLTYDDAANTLTIASTDTTLTTEQVQDIVGALLTDTGVIDVTYDDAGNVETFTIAAGSVTNAMLAGSIALSKLATDPLARANHTGTQLAATVSDFDAQVRTSRLDQMAAPTGALSVNGQKVSSLADGTAATDAVTKQQLDAAVNGIDWKSSVRVATTAAGTLASSFENGDTVDGVTLATGDRILIKNQAAGAENGIYVVAASGAPARASDADASAEVTGGLAVWVNEGTTNADTGWAITTNDAITLGTTALTFTQITGLGQVVDGAALTKTGNQLDVNVDGSTIEVASDALRVKALGITDAHIAAANKDGAAGTASLRTLGTGAAQAAAGNDARLTDTRTPTDGTVTTAKIVDANVTLAKIANIATARLLGRTTAGSGVPEELTASQVRTLLSLVIGTDVQAWDADLDTLAANNAGTTTWLRALLDATYILQSLVDAKGDLLVGTADNTVARKAVGTDGQVLTADAASAGGVKWATASSSGGGSPLPNYYFAR